MTSILDQAAGTFFAEAREMLVQMEDCLLRLDAEPGDRDTLDALFRSAHTIKGSAGLFGFDHVVSFTHEVETLLDRVRDGTIELTAPLVALLLRSADMIGRLIGAVESPAAEDGTGAARDAESRALLEALHAATGTRPGDGTTAAGGMAGGASTTAQATGTWHISVRFGREMFRNGMDPLAFLRYLSTLGDLEPVVTLDDAIPAAEDFDPETCYLGFEMRLSTGASREAIEEAFSFVREDCDLRLVPPGSRVEAYLALIEQLPEADPRLGEILVACGAVTRAELDRALATQARTRETEDVQVPIGALLASETGVPAQVVEAAAARQVKTRETRAEESRLLRIGADKLDGLINLVGELVIAGAGANLLAQRARDRPLTEATQTVLRLVEDIRNSALQLRMVQIGETFNRYRRVVHDVSKSLGKQIELTISGADTELDKSVVERIGDPLMHLVRNALDHGIEMPGERRAAGKPETARVSLNAFHDSGSIVIEVIDDGRGLDRDRILRKAIERGLVEAGTSMSDSEVLNLVFEAGFSTAERVTDLSGRGVGMDVVRRNIEALRGSVSLSSRVGEGTRVTIRLPLTLAIIDGFLVEVAGGSYVLPLDMVRECVDLRPEAAAQLGDAPLGCIDLHGEVLPVVHLAAWFGRPVVASGRRSVVVVRFGENRAGLVVDRLLGEFQTVIKPLGKLFAHLRGIGGSTILGSGEVALILDVPALVASAARGAQAQRKEEQTCPSSP
ncbi:MAG: chemotaxis protein CheA [bacterium]|jgi:two-component system chemotaxis sensor kinase CheA|nr:chemotaxis protein CheA [Betaproteobacteria bacterium]